VTPRDLLTAQLEAFAAADIFYCLVWLKTQASGTEYPRSTCNAPIDFLNKMAVVEGMLKLKSSQGEIFEVEPEVACMSTLIKNMVDDSGTDEEIPLPNVKTAILSKVIDYCKFHKDNPAEEIQKPLKSVNLVECGVSEWDSEYVNIEQEVLFELILAANYLDIKSLLDLTCAKVASMIKGKTPEEIRKQFNIVNDFTPEEEAQVREENRWCEDC
jgi:S-phase kinase-associated protein 1